MQLYIKEMIINNHVSTLNDHSKTSIVKRNKYIFYSITI